MTQRRSSRQTSKVTTIPSNEQLVNESFKLISKNDIGGLLKLFSDDAVVYEPFSKVQEGLHAKTAIEDFLKVSIMATEGLKKIISFEDKKEDRITDKVIFEREDTIKGKFSFHFGIMSTPSPFERKKIKSVVIQFLD